MHALWNILLLSVVIFAVSKILPQIHIKSFGTAIIVAIVYSIINFLIGWLLMLISLPAIFVTFGLFTFVVNAFLLWITDKIIDDFKIDNFTATLIAAFLITVFYALLRWIF
ncbi:MAG: phage holin family protein [Calditrichaeota bacterium]|nr:phage holin family protein [Calditrichota bacterium]